MEQRKILKHLDQREFKFHRPFGPYISECYLSDESHQILIRGAEKIRKNRKLQKQNDYRHRLAGNLTEEYNYDNALTKEESAIVVSEFNMMAWAFTQMSNKAISRDFKWNREDVICLKPIWVNFMKAGEWNPSHNHAGEISLVTYLKVPKEINEENTKGIHSQKSNTPTAGKIEFSYGDTIPFSNAGLICTPVEKAVYIFSAKLKHMVYPFKSKKERWSVSCNFANRKDLQQMLGESGETLK